MTSTQDGTLQLLTNNNSGDEIQFRKDGTFTFVNGGDSPGIFSVSTSPAFQEFILISIFLSLSPHAKHACLAHFCACLCKHL